MRIIKEGKPKEILFVCDRCGTEFAMMETEVWDSLVVVCPVCGATLKTDAGVPLTAPAVEVPHTTEGTTEHKPARKRKYSPLAKSCDTEPVSVTNDRPLYKTEKDAGEDDGRLTCDKIFGFAIENEKRKDALKADSDGDKKVTGDKAARRPCKYRYNITSQFYSNGKLTKNESRDVCYFTGNECDDCASKKAKAKK